MIKHKSILILVICSLIPLLFTSTIPFTLPTRLHLNSVIGNDHGWTGELKLYVVTLEAGSDYTIDVTHSTFWGMDTAIRIGEPPYMITGFSVDSGSSTGETMHFTAPKSGDYYIQIKIHSGSGFFSIVVESGTTGLATGSNEEFLDVSYLLVLILPSIAIFALGYLILKKLASRPERKPFVNIYKKDYWKKKSPSVSKEEIMICEYCGVEINKGLKKCPNCQASLE